MKEMKFKLKNENNNKIIYFHFKNNRVTINFVDGNEPEVVEVMSDYINNYLFKKGFTIMSKPKIKEIN